MALAMLPRRPTWPACVLPVASLRAGCLTGAVVLALRALEGMLRGGADDGDGSCDLCPWPMCAELEEVLLCARFSCSLEP